jgi:hypothetical protein
VLNPLDWSTGLTPELESWLKNYQAKATWSAPGNTDFQVRFSCACFMDDADPDPDPTVHFDADADPGSGSYPKFTHFGK